MSHAARHVGYGAAFAACWLEALDCGALLLHRRRDRAGDLRQLVDRARDAVSDATT